jgi:hypothetical protein
MLEITIAKVLEAAITNAIAGSATPKGKKFNNVLLPSKNGLSLSTSVRKPA